MIQCCYNHYLIDNPSLDFVFEKENGADESMKDFAKMTILHGLNQHPNDDQENWMLIWINLKKDIKVDGIVVL